MKNSFYYYLVENEFGKAYIKNAENSCIVLKIFNDNKIEATKYNQPFKKQPGDIIAEITKDKYQMALLNAIKIFQN